MNNYGYDPFQSPGPGPGTPPPSPGPGPAPGRGRPPAQGDVYNTISWIAGVGLIFVWFPLGLFLTIAHATGHDFLGDLLRRIFGRARGKDAASSGKAHRNPPAFTQTARAKKGAKAKESGRFDGVHHADAGTAPKTVFGWILTVCGGLGTVGAIGTGEAMWSILSTAAVALGGVALLISAFSGKRKEAKFRRCMTVSGDRGVVDIKHLAKTLGVDLAEADKTLTEMVDRGYYGEKAYIDHERCLLVIDVEDMRDVYRREDEAKAAAAAAKEKAESDEAKAKMSEYERYIEQIEQADVDIEDEVMSAKIQQMKSLTAAIFREIEAHPEKRSQIDRFMNYYLPTTLKLLESYARIEDYGVAGENMDKAKADIEGIADTLVEGYKKQLDKLYRAEAMDIAGDVSVIENMLKRDGLSGQNDFGTTLGGH